ncbi:DNA-directed RNA polymerase subunit delta [Sporosarcina oncorhynchi]|uniref:Probable DNA-directed RNA polymerase subunit delta n=1 Tax=Sporosarcina oncorhynchi TaxID=3056444 RepID=A0ABZ0L720_9BACL|nr:DNA-directed RNA polymerase subunit delta [Sporosarcina sp. T2O-4]WOV87974.1 DNA-directed RNA polymerase subunit delta [Sporosarcina sp. T2O-4]
MNLKELSKEELLEESWIDIAYAILTDRREPLTLKELMDEIRELTGLSEKQVKDRLPQFYTDMNIDGRFLAINDNRWGLREWYPVDQIEEETAPVVKVRKKKKKKKAYDDDEDEDDDDDAEEDELFDEGFDDIDDIDEEDDEDEDEDEEEVVEIDVDLVEDDDELEIIPDEELDVDDDEDEDDEDEDEL